MFAKWIIKIQILYSRKLIIFQQITKLIQWCAKGKKEPVASEAKSIITGDLEKKLEKNTKGEVIWIKYIFFYNFPKKNN